MEISRTLISNSTQSSCYYYSAVPGETRIGKSSPGVSRLCFRGGNRFPVLKGRGNCDLGFVEKGHLDYYYNTGVRAGCGEMKGKGKSKGWKEVSTKKKMKMLKGLVKDLSEFSELGFGLKLDCDEGFGVDDAKSKTISEAADILLAQLMHLRAEEEKTTMEKEDKKTKSKDKDCDESSSSSSSESSDSECDEVVDMKSFRKSTFTQTMEKSTSNQECCNMILETTLNDNLTIEALNTEASNAMRVEVCIGGKCKKAGSMALMEEFRRVVGDEGNVIGCKCLGQCKTSPNVKVMKGETGNSVLSNVGLEDVELIVANYMGEKKGFSVAIPAFP